MNSVTWRLTKKIIEKHDHIPKELFDILSKSWWRTLETITKTVDEKVILVYIPHKDAQKSINYILWPSEKAIFMLLLMDRDSQIYWNLITWKIYSKLFYSKEVEIKSPNSETKKEKIIKSKSRIFNNAWFRISENWTWFLMIKNRKFKNKKTKWTF